MKFKELFTEAGYEYWTITFNWDNKSYYFNVYQAKSTGRYQLNSDDYKKFESSVPRTFLKTASGTPMKEYSADKKGWTNAIKKIGGEYIEFSKGRSA